MKINKHIFFGVILIAIAISVALIAHSRARLIEDLRSHLASLDQYELLLHKKAEMLSLKHCGKPTRCSEQDVWDYELLKSGITDVKG